MEVRARARVCVCVCVCVQVLARGVHVGGVAVDGAAAFVVAAVDCGLVERAVNQVAATHGC